MHNGRIVSVRERTDDKLREKWRREEEQALPYTGSATDVTNYEGER